MTESSRFSRMPQRGTANSATSNEVDLLQVLFPRLGAAGVTSTDIVPSTSHCQQQIVNRDTQVGVCLN